MPNAGNAPGIHWVPATGDNRLARAASNRALCGPFDLLAIANHQPEGICLAGVAGRRRKRPQNRNFDRSN